MKQYKIDSYIETNYYRLFCKSEPINVVEFNAAFATNPFYKSGSPLARNGSIDIFVEPIGGEEVDYSCGFVDYLKDVDRISVTDRVAYFSLMRAYLPSFSIIDHMSNEYKISAFASFYEDGYFSITYLYDKIGLCFKTDQLKKLYQWNEISYVELDITTIKMLNFKYPEELEKNTDKAVGVKIPIEVFNQLFGDKFALGRNIVLTIVQSFLERNSIETLKEPLHFQQFLLPYSYLVLNTDSLENVDTAMLANVLYAQEENSFTNELLSDVGVDLTCAPDSLMRGHRKFLYYIGAADAAIGAEKLLVMFSSFDACILEKIKYIQAIGEMNKLIYTKDFNFEKLLNARYRQLTSSKEAICYEYKDDLLLSIKAIRLALGLADYKIEYVELCNIAEEIIIRHASIRNDEEEKMRAKEEKKKAEAMSILTIILTVPSVVTLVDIFYGLTETPIISFPINLAKLLWVLGALILSLCYFYLGRIKKACLKLLSHPKKKGKDEMSSL